MPYASGPTIWSASGANGVSATARRTRVFLTTRKYTPDVRALARSCVIAATGRPRFSAKTMAWAPATCLRDFRDYRLLLFQIETQGLPPFLFGPAMALRARPPLRRQRRLAVTLRQENSCLRGTICAGSGDRGQRTGIRKPSCHPPSFIGPVLSLAAPAVFDGPPDDAPSRVPSNRSDSCCPVPCYLRSRRLLHEARRVHAHACTHGAGDADLLEVDALGAGRLGLVERLDQRQQVGLQLLGLERRAADRALDDAAPCRCGTAPGRPWRSSPPARRRRSRSRPSGSASGRGGRGSGPAGRRRSSRPARR